METTKRLPVLLIAVGMMALVGCAKRQLTPARVIPQGDENTTICKSAYLECRGQCFNTEEKKIMKACGNQCEKDVDTCLLQSRAPE